MAKPNSRTETSSNGYAQRRSRRNIGTQGDPKSQANKMSDEYTQDELDALNFAAMYEEEPEDLDFYYYV